MPVLFNSLHFLLFFPVVTLIYFVLPQRTRWVWLLAASYYFYMSWNPRYALLIAFSTMITYASGLLMAWEEKCNRPHKVNRKKIWVALSFLINIAILTFFKYFDFLINSLNGIMQILGMRILNPGFDILLPVGISFYTFQALSYTVDVYRNEIPVEKNLARYALFVSFFPQLVAGPIERSANLLRQINEPHAFSFENLRHGLVHMLWGYFQKMVVADRIAIVVATVYDHPEAYAGFPIIVATMLFAFQIYCDFSGYSEIAKGAAQIMGFDLMTNFRSPYFATSIQGFWRRWHVSLSTWFRDYVYIPLGGNRGSKAFKYRNLMITFLVSGLWHGASWNFVFWGGLHGFYQIVGDWLKPYKIRVYQYFHIKDTALSFRLGKVLMTFALTCFAWIFFRAAGLHAAVHMIRGIFATFNPQVLVDGSLYTLGLPQSDFILAVLAIIVILIVDYSRQKVSLISFLDRQNLPLRWIVYLGLLFAVLVFGYYGPQLLSSQFIYFQF